VITAVLFVVALGLRFTGIDQGLPHHGEPDTYIVAQAEQLIREGLGDRFRAGWKYPHFVATVVAAVPAADIVRPPEGASLAEHRAVATALHLRTRKVAAFLSAIAAPATFLIALRFLPLGWAALAGLITASSLLHICFSVQARPHGPVSGLAALAVLGALRWSERPSAGRALFLGLTSACAIGSLHTGLAVLAPITVAAITVLRRHRDARRSIVLSLVAVSVLLTATTAWFYVRPADGFGLRPAPATATATAEGVQGNDGASLLHDKLEARRPVERREGGRSAVRFSGHVIDLGLFNGRGFGVAWRTLRAYDPLLLAFGLLGLAAALARRKFRLRPGTWIVVGFALPTLMLYGMYAKSTDRFLLLLLPAVALLAANGLRVAATRVPGLGRPIAALVTLAVVVGALRTAQLRIRPDTASEAATWLVANVDGEAPTHLTNLRSIPLFVEPANVTQDFIWSRGPWEAYQWALLHPESRPVRGEPIAPSAPTPDGAERLGRRLIYTTVADRYRLVLESDHSGVARDLLADADPDHAVLVVNPSSRAGPVDEHTLARAWRTPLQDGRWVRVHRIESGLSDDETSLGYTLDFTKVFRARALGPTIEVYARRDR